MKNLKRVEIISPNNEIVKEIQVHNNNQYTVFPYIINVKSSCLKH